MNGKYFGQKKKRDTENDKCDTNKTIKTELHTEQKKEWKKQQQKCNYNG